MVSCKNDFLVTYWHNMFMYTFKLYFYMKLHIYAFFIFKLKTYTKTLENIFIENSRERISVSISS